MPIEFLVKFHGINAYKICKFYKIIHKAYDTFFKLNKC